MANQFSTKETIHANGIPPLIAEDISDRLWLYAQNAYKNDGDLILVHQNTINFKETTYTIDYITTQIMGVWHQYKVIYAQDSVSPLPHTIDFRFQTNEALAVPPPSTFCSSSAFRAAAYAKLNPLPPPSTANKAAVFAMMSFK